MTTKPKAQKFRIRRSSSTANAADPVDPTPPTAAPAQAAPSGVSGNVDSAKTVASETDIDAIRQEGLTGRQLRMARRVAQKNGLAVTSDFDAVRQLRHQGIDPFQRANVLELVTPNDAQTKAAAGQMKVATAKVPAEEARVQLPQTVQRGASLPSTHVGPHDNPAEQRAGEIRRIQKDIAKRRRRNMLALFGRLGVFVILPTFAAAWYFFVMATPMYGTMSKFNIQQADGQSSAGLGGLFQGTGLASQEDSVKVQEYLGSRAAMLRLDEDHGYIAHFQDENIDAIQRLAADATQEDAYALYTSNVEIGYDPTEGILQMEVIAADPALSQTFSEALIRYAENEVDQSTQRVRDAGMLGARDNFNAAVERRNAALEELVRVQQATQTGALGAEQAALQQRITTLQIELDQENLNLASLRQQQNPRASRVEAVEIQINLLEGEIASLRSQLSGEGSIVIDGATVRLAEENYAFEVANVQAAQASMDTATIEANRQVRYLSIAVPPIAPDEATYPKAFENTVLAFLIFSGIYLMISLTASILREQVSS